MLISKEQINKRNKKSIKLKVVLYFPLIIFIVSRVKQTIITIPSPKRSLENCGKCNEVNKIKINPIRILSKFKLIFKINYDFIN